MEKLRNLLARRNKIKILVIGDIMLDEYIWGKVDRISPEAPVPVMEVRSQQSRPGGAGNVVLNLTALGGQVIAMGRLGADAQGKELQECLSLEGVDQKDLTIEPGYRTPVKNRLIADSQQLLRVDLETITPLIPALEQEMIALLPSLIAEVQVVAISDYGKGFLTVPLLQAAIHIARNARVPILIDPKGSDFTKYHGATLLKPNLTEAYAAAKLPTSAPLDTVARHIFSLTQMDLLLITRSEAGMTLFDAQGTRTDFPVRSREVKDVTGAGDTVLAMICLALASGFDMDIAAQLANIAAGIAIERVGCVQVTLAELAQRLLALDSETKVFDEHHMYALHQVLKGKKYILLVLQKGQEMTSQLLRSIRQLARREGEALIIYVHQSHPDEEFIHFLSSLQEVNSIILQTESLKHLCTRIHPHAVYLFEKEREAMVLEQDQFLSSTWLNDPATQA